MVKSDVEREDTKLFAATQNSRRIAALMAAVLIILAALSFAACGKKQGIVVPEGLTREEAALYMAVAKVCPKNDNHSKMDYLTFRIEGWSFDKLPQAVFEYLSEYCSSGGAYMMQFDDETLESMGLIKKGDGDFFGEDENVYAEGKGKIFTFTLKEGESLDADTCSVSVKGFISERDSSGFDVDLAYENGAWSFVKYSNAWNTYQFITPDPNATVVPEK